MECSEFRRLLMIDPQRREGPFLAHLRRCPQCAGEAERVWELEKKLRVVLDVAPAAAPLPAPGPPTQRHRWALAGLALALGLSVWLGIRWDMGVQPRLAEVVLEHIKNEPEALRLDRNPSAGRVALLLSKLGGRLTADPGPVRYVKCCPIRQRLGLHLVLPGARGPVTVLLMPGEKTAGERHLDSAYFSGVIVPTDYGSMAVVGERREPVEAVVERFRNAVTWKPAPA